jgi:hypothetical protein
MQHTLAAMASDGGLGDSSHRVPAATDWKSAACGGQSRGNDPGSGGGGSGSGATMMGGSAGTSVSGSGTSGSGTSGSGTTGGAGIGDGCIYNSAYYRVTASFPAVDGCNTCTCENYGTIVCTRDPCLDCGQLAERFPDALLEAKRCDPQLPAQCTVNALSGLQCGCATYVNDDTELRQLAEQFGNQPCLVDIACRNCGRTPVAGRCNEDYVCVDEYAKP